MRAFVAVVVAAEGTLLGGARLVESYPFEARKDAERWASNVIFANSLHGRTPVLDDIKEVAHPTPIPAERS